MREKSNETTETALKISEADDGHAIWTFPRRATTWKKTRAMLMVWGIAVILRSADAAGEVDPSISLWGAPRKTTEPAAPRVITEHATAIKTIDTEPQAMHRVSGAE